MRTHSPYLLSMLAAMLLAACGSGDSAETGSAPAAEVASGGKYGGQTLDEIAAAGEPTVGGRLILRMEKETATLNYVLDTSDAYTADVCIMWLQEGLVDRNRDTFDYEPLLAKEWEISDDHLTYTFHIDERATFSDGTPVTTADVKFTFDTILDPNNETADIRGYIKDITEIELIDEHTIRFQVSKPYFKHLDMIGSIPIFAKHVYEDGDFNTHPANRAPVGSGPYVFDRWDTNQQIVLKRRADYWRAEDAGYFDEVVFKIISEADAAFQVAERGELDKDSVSPEKWMTRVVNPDFQERYRGVKYWAHDGYVGGVSFITWNTRLDKFSDKRTRQALAMLMNREGIVQAIYHDLAKVVGSSIAWQTSGYDQSIEPWPFDPARAKALLDEVGWKDTDGDGVRDKDGEPFEFEFLFVPGKKENERWLNEYQQELLRAGVKLNIRPVEWASMLESLVAREYEATTLRWAIPVDSDPFQLWHSTMADTGSNYPGLMNEEADRIIEEARLEFDPEKRGALYRQLHAILHEEQPYVFLWNSNELSIVKRDIEGVFLHKVGLYPRAWWRPVAL